MRTRRSSRCQIAVPLLVAGCALLGVTACGGASAKDTSATPASTSEPSAPASPSVSASATTVGASVAASTSSLPSGEREPVLPVTFTDSTGKAVTIRDVSRIIPVNGDIAEVVYALGLGGRVVATDISATYPDAATRTPRIGYQRALTTETILSFDPTVVLADDLAGPPEVLDQLRSTGIPVVVIHRDKDLDAPETKIMAVATALGVPGRGRALADTTAAEIAAAREHAEQAVAASGRPRVLALYLRGAGVQLTFGKGSGVDVFIDAAGATDVGTEAGIVDTQQLSDEAVVKAAPDILLVTTTGLESVGGIDGLVKIKGIADTPAGRNRRVIAFEDQYLYGFGPRSGLLLSDLVTAFHS